MINGDDDTFANIDRLTKIICYTFTITHKATNTRHTRMQSINILCFDVV